MTTYLGTINRTDSSPNSFAEVNDHICRLLTAVSKGEGVVTKNDDGEILVKGIERFENHWLLIKKNGIFEFECP